MGIAKFLTMLLLFKMLLVLAASGWVIITTRRRIWLLGFGRAWRLGFILSGLMGLALGFWFLNRTYLVSPTGKAIGVPFIIAGGDFIDGRWLMGGVGRFLYLAFLADVASGVALCVLPLTIILFLRMSWRRQSGSLPSHSP